MAGCPFTNTPNDVISVQRGSSVQVCPFVLTEPLLSQILHTAAFFGTSVGGLWTYAPAVNPGEIFYYPSPPFPPGTISGVSQGTVTGQGGAFWSEICEGESEFRFAEVHVTVTFDTSTGGILDTVMVIDAPYGPDKPDIGPFLFVVAYDVPNTQRTIFYGVIVKIVNGVDCSGTITPPPPEPGKSNEDGVSLLSHRVGFYLGFTQSGMAKVWRSWGHSVPFDTLTIVDANADCADVSFPPTVQLNGEGISVLYRRGDGKERVGDDPTSAGFQPKGMFPVGYSPTSPNLAPLGSPAQKGDPKSRYDIWRRVSYDWAFSFAGVNYAPDDGSGNPPEEKPILEDIKNARELFVGARGERWLLVYNDASIKDKDGNKTQTGYMRCKVFDAGTFVGDFPDDSKGIGGDDMVADDAPFGLTYTYRESNETVRLTFLSKGTLKFFVSVDEGVSWVDITDQIDNVTT